MVRLGFAQTSPWRARVLARPTACNWANVNAESTCGHHYRLNVIGWSCRQLLLKLDPATSCHDPPSRVQPSLGYGQSQFERRRRRSCVLFLAGEHPLTER